MIGRIARAHGRRGEVVVNVDTDFPEERFRPGAEVFIERDGAVVTLVLTTVRFHRERPIIGVSGVETMTDAEALAGRELRIPRAWLSLLPANTFYRHDLIGCHVETSTGVDVGRVEAVEGTIGGSRLVVGTTSGEVLIPLASEICTTIDVASRRIVINPPEGLLDLNR